MASPYTYPKQTSKPQRSAEPSSFDDLGAEPIENNPDFNDYEKKADRYLGRDIFSGTKLTGKAIRTAAEETYKNTGKLIPVEFVLAQGQDETKLGKELKTENNFFNVGNFDDVKDKSGKVIKKGRTTSFATPEAGVSAYTNLLAKDYLVDKEPDDLLENFVNKDNSRYASDEKYEQKMKENIDVIKGFTEAEDIQSALKEKGYDPGPVDGVFGPKTEKALKKFQKDKGLKPDGLPGPKTRKGLLSMIDDALMGDANASEVGVADFSDLGAELIEDDSPEQGQAKDDFSDLGAETIDEKLSTELSTGVNKERKPNNAIEIAKGGLRGLQGIAAGTGGLIDMAGQNIQREAEKMLFVNQPGVSKEERSKKAESLSKIGKKVSEWGKTAKDFWTKASQEGIAAPDPEMFTGSFMQKPSWTRAATIVAEAVPSLGAATAASIAAGGNPMVGLAFLGSIEGEQTFSEARSAGKSVDDANRFFGMAALGTSVLEALPLTRFLKGGEGKLVKDMFVGGVQEGGEEGLQNLWQNVIAQIGYDKTRSLTEGMVESVIGGAGSGGVMGGLTSGRAKKVDKEIKQAIEAGVPQVAIDAMQEAVANQIVANAEEVEKAITDVGTKKTVDVNVTPKMEGAKESGLPAIEVKPEIEAVLEKSNLSEGRRSAIIKLLETPEKPKDTGEAMPETKPAVSTEAKGEEQTPPIISEETPSVNQDQKRLEADTGVSEEVKPQDFKTAEEYVASKMPKDIKEVMKSWDAKGIKNHLSEKDDSIILHQIVVPKENRGEGIGKAAMKELIDYADAKGKSIYLTPTGDFGGSVSRLKKFYKEFGFRNYKGYSFRETMVRDAQKSQLTAEFNAAKKPVQKQEEAKPQDSKTVEEQKILTKENLLKSASRQYLKELRRSGKPMEVTFPKELAESITKDTGVNVVADEKAGTIRIDEQKPVQKQEEGADVDTIAKALADRLKQNLADYHRKFAKAVIDKDADALSKWIATAESANKNSRAVFTQFTGVKLPTTIEGKRKAIYEWAGKEIPKPKEKAPEPPKMSKEDAAKKMIAARDEKVLATNIRYQGQIMTKKEMVDSLVAKGWVPVVSEQPKIKDVSRRAYNNMDGRQQAEFERRQREAGTKQVYYLEDKKAGVMVEVGKVAHDYALTKQVQPEVKEKAVADASLFDVKKDYRDRPSDLVMNKYREFIATGKYPYLKDVENFIAQDFPGITEDQRKNLYSEVYMASQVVGDEKADAYNKQKIDEGYVEANESVVRKAIKDGHYVEVARTSEGYSIMGGGKEVKQIYKPVIGSDDKVFLVKPRASKKGLPFNNIVSYTRKKSFIKVVDKKGNPIKQSQPEAKKEPAKEAEKVESDWEKTKRQVAEAQAKWEKEKSEKKPEPEQKPKQNKELAVKLRSLADKLEEQIDSKINSGSSKATPTARRARIASGMYEDGMFLKKIQTIMRTMADEIDAGTLPKELEGVNSKAIIEYILRRERMPDRSIHGHTFDSVLKAIDGKSGSVKLKQSLGYVRKNEYAYSLTKEQGEVFKDIVAMAQKYSNDYSIKRALDDIRDFDRINNAGITTQEEYKNVRSMLKEREGGLSESDKRAKRIKDLEAKFIGVKMPGFFPTPRPTAEKIVDLAEIKEGMKVLEPSAGMGGLADIAKDRGAYVSVYEISPSLQELLREKGHNVVGSDFMDEKPSPIYDRIIMNPPFEKMQDVDHVMRAFEFLKPGGKLVSITSESPFFRDDKKAQDFRDFVEEHGYSEKLPEGSFKSSFVSTGVNTRVVVLDKAESVIEQPKPAEPVTPVEKPKEQVKEDNIPLAHGFYAKKEGERYSVYNKFNSIVGEAKDIAGADKIAMELGPKEKKTTEKQKAYFKVKVGAEWRVPKVTMAGKKQTEIKKSDSKEINAEKAIKAITDSLDNPEIEYEGDYVKISGYPKSGKAGMPTSKYGSVGSFTEEVQQASAKTDIEIKPVENIEVIKMVRFLTGGVPTIKQFRKDGKQGEFQGIGKGSIRLIPDLFKRGNEKQLAGTLKHEVGHLTDFMPEGTMKRGNILGRTFSLRGFLKTTFSSKTGEGIDKEQLRKETLNEYLEANGLSLGQWIGDKNVREAHKEGVKAHYELRLKEVMEEGGYITKDEIRDELKAVSFMWRPFDQENADPSYTAYRLSSAELYADAISVLLNSPGTLQEKAPKFFKAFFDAIDKKPNVKEAYIAAQKLMNGTPEEIMAARQEDIRTMFVKGENIRENLEEQAKVKENNLYERLRQWLDDKYFPLTNKLEKGKRNGVIPTSDAAHLLQELDLWQNDAYALTKEIDSQVLAPLKETTATMADLSEFMFLKRIIGKTSISADEVIAQLKDAGLEDFLGGLGIDIVDTKEEAQAIKAKQTRISETGAIITEEVPVTSWEEQVQKWKEKNADREDLANPLGFDTATAQRQIDYLKKQIGDEAFNALEKSADKYHELIFKIMEDAVEAGVYSKEVFEKVIRPNKNYYVTFGVLDYLDNSVPAGIKSQRGTLKEVESPFITTILKTISLIRANAKNRAVSSGITQLAQQFPNDANESKRIIIGGVPARFANPKKGLGQVRFLREGKLVSYDVDQYIAESFANDTPTMTALGANLNKFLGNRFFKGLVITYSPAFQIFNIQRDFKRTYINLNALGKNVSIKSLLGAYWKALPVSVRRMTGVDDALIAEMMANKALDIPFNDFNFDDRDDGFARILRKYNVIGDKMEAKTVREKIVKGWTRVDAAVRFVGNVIETIPKVAGYNIMKEKGVSDRNLGYITRNYIGTPNFRTKGNFTKVTNELFVFSNIAIQGWKSDMTLATRPTTRAGYWLADFKVNMLPKLLMVAAILGLAGKDLEEWFEKVPEYDKTNFIIIPLGVDKEGRAVYHRIPHNETSRLFSAVLYKVLTAGENKGKDDIADVFSVAGGIVPGIAPGASIIGSWGAYLSGKNPYDDYRGQYAISDKEFKAGGWPKLKKMVEFTFNEAGFSQFSTYDDRRDSTFEAGMKASPFLNSWFRIVKTSDYGVSERARAILNKEDQESAQRSLKRDELFDKQLKGYRSEDIGRLIDGSGSVSRGDIKKKLFDISVAIYDGEPSKENLKTTEKAFIRYAMKEQNNPYVKAVLSAQSNDAKIKILQEAKNELPIARYNEMANRLKRSRLISKEVYQKVR